MRKFYKKKPGFSKQGPPRFRGKRKGFGPSRDRGKGAGGGGAGEGRRQLPPMNQIERQVYNKALDLQKKMGIPFDDAFEIAARGTTVSVKKFKTAPPKSRIDDLAAEYRLSRSLAGNVLAGNLPLEKAVLRNELRRNLEANRHRSCLVDAKDSGEEIELQLIGGKSMTGRVLDVQPYSFNFRKTPKTKKPTKETEHLKLTAKYGYPPAFSRFVSERLIVDADLKAKSLKPPRKVIERRMIKNEKLQRLLMAKARVMIKTYEGDTFNGVLAWWGQYEFGLDVGDGVVVTFFRHAIYLLYQA